MILRDRYWEIASLSLAVSHVVTLFHIQRIWHNLGWLHVAWFQQSYKFAESYNVPHESSKLDMSNVGPPFRNRDIATFLSRRLSFVVRRLVWLTLWRHYDHMVQSVRGPFDLMLEMVKQWPKGTMLPVSTVLSCKLAGQDQVSLVTALVYINIGKR